MYIHSYTHTYEYRCPGHSSTAQRVQRSLTEMPAQPVWTLFCSRILVNTTCGATGLQDLCGGQELLGLYPAVLRAQILGPELTGSCPQDASLAPFQSLTSSEVQSRDMFWFDWRSQGERISRALSPNSAFWE